MKKLMALFLCTVMLSCTFASCKGGESATETDGDSDAQKEQIIDLKQYVIIRSENASSGLVGALVKMKKSTDELLDSSLTIKSDKLYNGAEADDEAFEILVGNTNRTQSQEVLATVEGNKFAIATVGNKIVIVGNNDTLTAEGVAYFFDNYISKTASEGTIKLPEGLKFVSDEHEVVELINGKKCKYSIVFSEKLDNTPDSKKVVDYQVSLAQDIHGRIVNLAGATATLETDRVQKGTDPSEKYEILVGDTNREETKQAREMLSGVDEYGVFFIGNKIVLAAWNEETLEMAVSLFIGLMENSVYSPDGQSKQISFLKSTEMTGTTDKYVTDIPAFEGGTLAGCVTCNDDQLEYYYTSCTSSGFEAYRSRLVSEGYKLYLENTIGNNIFATYTKGDTFVHAYYVRYNNTVRIITGLTSTSPSLPTELSPVEAEQKVSKVTLTQMALNYTAGNYGMCYIVTLEDGSFIVVDGGVNLGSGQDHVKLYNLLKSLNKRPDGKIVISAWLLTHNHADHYGVFHDFCIKYGSQVTVKQCIANYPDSYVAHNSKDPGNHMQKQFSSASKAVGGIKIVKPHTGMKFYVGTVELEVLYTPEDIYPEYLHVYNDSSMVIRMSVGEQSIMWLGDIEDVASSIICNMYGNNLKADIVQVSHDGGHGASVDVYKYIRPSVALFSCRTSYYPEYVYHHVATKWLDTNCEKKYVADEYHYRITFGETFTANIYDQLPIDG